MVSRRNLLAGSVIGTGVVLGTRPASALTSEDVPAHSGLGLSLSNRCGGDAEHAKIAATLRAKLGAEGAAIGNHCDRHLPDLWLPGASTPAGSGRSSWTHL